MYCPLDRTQRPPFPLKPTETYLGEDESGYYVMDGFFSKMGNMFKRMVKFTPKSFKPSTIMRAMTNTAMVAVTGGAYLALPSKLKNTIETAGTYVIPAAAGAYVAATAGPAVMSALGPKLSSVASALGKNISSIGKGLFDIMGKLSPSQQAQVAQRVTPQDILYSERNQGQFPPQFMNYVDEVARSNYGYAVNASLPASQQDARQYYADSSLYPGLQQAMQTPQEEPAGSWSSGEVAAAVGAGVVVAYLIGKK